MKNTKNEETRARYTIPLSPDLHAWLLERADGGAVSSVIVFILNQVRLGDLVSKAALERKEEKNGN